MMRRNKICSKILLGFSLCMAFLLTGIVHGEEKSVQASSLTGKWADTTIYRQKFMSQCCPMIKSKGEVYITGDKNNPTYKDRVTVYAVPYGTKIQGYTIEKKYLPNGNIKNLQEIFSSVTGSMKGWSWIKSGEYQETGGAKQTLVAYDDRNVIFWSNGYRAFPENKPAMCHQADIMQSHPPGFYIIPRSQAWLNVKSTYDQYNKIPSGTKLTYEATAKTTKEYLGIRALPGEVTTGDVYRVKSNTELHIADLQKVVLHGGKDPYYKVLFKANNDVNYLGNWSYFYVQAKYLNVYRNSEKSKIPTNLSDGKVVDTYYKDINIYKEPSTKVSGDDNTNKILGYVQKDAVLQYDAKESNSNWTKIYYNNAFAYIQTKYITKINKPAVVKTKPMPKNVRVKTIKNNEYVMTWDKAAEDCKDYRIILTKNPSSTSKSNVVYRNNHCKSNTFTVKESLLKKNTKTGLYLLVAANYSYGTSNNVLSDLIYMDSKPKAFKTSQLKIYKNEIKFVKYYTDIAKLQYSTNKSFKNAKTVKASNGIVKSIKKLKRKTNYYIRYATQDYVDTDAGGKMICTEWSSAIKVKTK